MNEHKYVMNGDYAGGGGMFGGVAFMFLVIFLLILFWGRKDGHGERGHVEYGCQPSNWQVEKQEILDACKTQEIVMKDGEKTRERIDYLNIKSLEEKLFDLKIENSSLKQSAFIGAEFGRLNHRLDRFECEMPKRPPFHALGCSTCTIPTGFSPFGGRGGCHGDDLI
jgi:hypothetical protein